jgi:hypothetical protein
MIPLVFSIWRKVMTAPIEDEDKIIAISAVLQVYASLMGLTDEDFQDLMHATGELYQGPLPDGYSEEIVNYYKETKSHE